MKEKVLREMIRKQIMSSLSEAPTDRVGTSLGRVEKMASVKMLKKALGQGSPQQQASGLLKVIQAISGDNPTVGKVLARMLQKGGISEPAAETPAIEENQALKSRAARVDKTQAMIQLKQQLKTKPATAQTDFVIDMINGVELKDAAKKRLLLQLRKNLK
jgi:hypothetical protein